MITPRLASTLAVLLIGLVATLHGAGDVVSVSKRVRPFVSHVQSQAFHMGVFLKIKTGSAVFVGNQSGGDHPRSIFVTNAHVVENSDFLTITTDDNRSFPVSIAYFDRQQDLAFLVSASVSFPEDSEVPIISRRTLDVGETVVAVGSPIGLRGTVSTGIVSAIREVDGMRYVQTSASVSPGSSGGGLFDLNGRLIGIITFKVVAGENLNFAIDSSLVGEVAGRLLQRLGPIPDPHVSFAIGKDVGLSPRGTEPNPARELFLSQSRKLSEAKKSVERLFAMGIGASRDEIDRLNRYDAMALSLLSAYPNHLGALDSLVWARSTEMLSAALMTCDKSLSNSSAGRFISARLLLASGDTRQAEKVLREIFNELPTRGQILLPGFNDEAIEMLNSSIDSTVGALLARVLLMRPQLYKELLMFSNKKGWSEDLRKLTPY